MLMSTLSVVEPLTKRISDMQSSILQSSYQYCMMKANQHWEMAGLARADGDKVDAEKHTSEARRWEQRARET
jgi:hypothetical protein